MLVFLKKDSFRFALLLSILMHALAILLFGFSVTRHEEKKIEFVVSLISDAQIAPVTDSNSENVQTPPPVTQAPPVKKIIKNKLVKKSELDKSIKATPLTSESQSSFPVEPLAADSKNSEHSQNVAPQTQSKETVQTQVLSQASTERKDRDDYGDVLARHISKFKYYPKYALMHQIQGSVIVELQINQNGELISSRISRGSGHDVLDIEAMKMVKKASPLPTPIGNLKGKTFFMYVPIEFLLG